MGEIVRGILVPFAGTTLGAALVFFMRREVRPALQRALTGFAAGVMVAAAVWSLLLPAIGLSGDMGAWSFVPAAGGFWAGALFLLLLDAAAPRPDGPGRAGARFDRLLLAVTIHNVPEGMAVGVVYAGLLAGRAGITPVGAFALALGIAIQNLPEGAIISLPLQARGASRPRAFAAGALTGAVEPLGALLMLAAAARLSPLMPWFLGFAAGAMICVAADELIPEMSGAPGSRAGVLMFTCGFTLMMALDVALG